MLIPLDRMITNYNLAITGILHVGAHIGEEASTYQACGIHKVLWIEGNPELIPELEANVFSYGHKVVQALITDEDDNEITFNVTNNFMSSSIYEFGTHSVVSPEVHYTHTLTLPTSTLDTLSQHHDMTDMNFLNMDLQGAELAALNGGEKLLAQIDYIYTEVNVDELYKDCTRLPALDAWLKRQMFYRIETVMAGSAGWGDALYVRQ